MKTARTLSYKTKPGHYAAQAFIVRCFDDRFRPAFEKFLKAQKITHADFESVAGGAKIFSSPEHAEDRDFMMRELEKSIKLHHTRQIMLFTHQDCGAYGGMARFDEDKEKEEVFHRKELAAAREYLQRRFPDLSIASYFMDFEGIVKISWP